MIYNVVCIRMEDKNLPSEKQPVSVIMVETDNARAAKKLAQSIFDDNDMDLLVKNAWKEK